MLPNQLLEKAVKELEQARSQFCKLAKLAQKEPKLDSPDDIRESVLRLFEHFLNDGKQDELKQLFAIRCQCDVAMALALRRLSQENTFEVRQFKSQLEQIVTRMELFETVSTPDVHAFVNLDFEFHASIAEFAGYPEVAGLIAELGKEHFSHLLSQLFSRNLISRTITEHKSIIEEIFAPGKVDSKLKRLVSRHATEGLFQKQILRKAGGNASKLADRPGRVATSYKDRAMSLLTDELLSYYKDRVIVSFENQPFPTRFWNELVDELGELEKEIGSNISVSNFDAVVERRILQQLHGDGKYILFHWNKWNDSSGDSRLTAKLVAACTSYSETIEKRRGLSESEVANLVVVRPVLLGYSLAL